MRHVGLIALVAFAALLMYASAGLPKRGDIDSPAHRDTSLAGTSVAANYYIRNTMRDTRTPNIVTTVLGDYRSFDTLGEVVVVLTAGLCCTLILRRRKE
ncbi:hypothetical protein FBQ87_02210 [Sphingobacteriales bacterium CHB3]|nr:hypothetical protein [Sphingobacteriales bacterium CHB3]